MDEAMSLFIIVGVVVCTALVFWGLILPYFRLMYEEEREARRRRSRRR